MVQAAHVFNQPLTLITMPMPSDMDEELKPSHNRLDSIFKVTHAAPLGLTHPHHDRPPLLIDTIKLAEDQEEGSVAVIVRLYEPYGCRGRARVQWDEKVLGVTRSVKRCNLLEEEDPDQVDGQVQVNQAEEETGVVLDFGPFAIYSLQIRF